MNSRTFHDYNTENKLFMIISGFYILKSPLSHFFLNVIYLVCQFTFYLYLFTMAIYTMSITGDDKVLLIRAFHSFCLLFLAMVVPYLKHFADRSLTEANKLIKNGIFKYTSEESNERQNEILIMRVSQIRLAISVFTKLLLTCALVYIFVFPFMQWLTIQRPLYFPVNPYLPLPFYVPFNTTTYLGYSLAFFTNAVFFSFFFISVLCLEVTYISCAAQLIAQIEMLNFSLLNIENRAMAILHKKKLEASGLLTEGFDVKMKFQQCLYYCLRENIIHHHAILRFKDEVSPYLELVNGAAITVFSIIMASSIYLILEEPNINMAILMALISEIVCYFLICLIGEFITDKSNETAQSLYSTPWPYCNDNFKLLLKIMATYLKKPIIFKSRGYNSVCSLETFGEMMGVGYKLVSILR